MDDVEKLRRQRLLVDPSNDRQNSRNVSFELPQCPKTVEFESPLVSSDDEVNNLHIIVKKNYELKSVHIPVIMISCIELTAFYIFS